MEQREIEALEQREAQAMRGADVSTLQTLWADDLIVNSTSNLIAGKQILLEMIRNGRLKLRTYERRPVRIVVFGDLVVTTGNEVSQLIGDTAEFKMFVSYMNVWTKRERKLATARASRRTNPAREARTSAMISFDATEYLCELGDALSLAERRASTNRLMTAASSAGSTGFTTWLSKPDAKTSTRSSTRP